MVICVGFDGVALWSRPTEDTSKGSRPLGDAVSELVLRTVSSC